MMATPTTALRRTSSARWAHVGAWVEGLHQRDLRAAGEYLCIADLAPSHGRAVVCCINGEFIGRADWWQPVRAGDKIVFAEIAGKGDTGRTIAMLVVAVAAAWVSAGASGTFTAGSWQAAAAGAATSIAGGLLVNRLFPAQAGTAAEKDASPTYNASVEGNQVRLWQTVPVRYGSENLFPDVCCPAYTDFGDDSEAYYNVGLGVGLGEYEILAIFVDDTPLQHFSDVTAQIVGPGMTGRIQKTGYPAVEGWDEVTVIATGMVTSREVAGQDIITDTWIGPLVLTPAGTQVDELHFDLMAPRGIGTVDGVGNIGSRTIGWQMAWQRIDDNGIPLNAWNIQPGTRTAATSRPVRISVAHSVPPGRYRVRVRRATPRDDSDRALNDLQWVQTRGRLDVPGVRRNDVTGVALRVRASQQLSALSQRRIKVLAQRLLPVHDGSAWQPAQATRNPAWALADVWRNQTYGRALPDDRIDLASLLDCAQTWAARQDRFDYSFDTQRSIDDASQTIAAAGRARTLLRRGAVYSLVRDEPQTEAVGVFMPRNIDRDSFGLEWSLPTSETPDCIAVVYRDGRVWSDRTVYAQVHAGQLYGYAADAVGVPLRPDGLPPPAMVEEVQAPGIIGQHQAIRHAVYLLARSLYRREEGQITADTDGLMVTMGSLVGVAHDAAGWGQSGDVVDWDVDTLTMTLSEPPVWQADGTHYVRLQAHTGELGGAIEVTPGADGFEVVLAEAPVIVPSVDSPDRERTRYLFGELSDVQRHAVVADVRPRSDDEIAIRFFLEDARVHQADQPWLPTGDEEQDPISDGTIGSGSGGGGGGGDLPIVGLSDQIHSHVSIGALASVSLEFGDDGVLRLFQGGAGGAVPEQWLVFAPFDPAVAALFEIQFVLLDPVDLDVSPQKVAPDVATSSVLDTWLNLGETRRISLARWWNEPATTRLSATIRDVETATTQASAVLLLAVMGESPP